MLWVCPPRLYSRTCQYPTQKGRFLKSIETVAQRRSVKKVFLEISHKIYQKTPAPESLRPWDLRPATLLKKRLSHRCFPVKFAKFLRTTFLSEHLRWLLLRVPNFVSVLRLCTIQNTSNSSAKAHLRALFLQNSTQWLLSNVSHFFKKGKNRNNFSYLLRP